MKYTLGSVYAPTQDKPQDQATFMDQLETALQDMKGTSIILAGEYNCILDPDLDRSSSRPTTVTVAQYRHRLKNFMEESKAMYGGLNIQIRAFLPSEEPHTHRG